MTTGHLQYGTEGAPPTMVEPQADCGRWTAACFPPSMQDLSPLVREKAIEIANALVEQGVDEAAAIHAAVDQAKEWVSRLENWAE